MQFCKGYDFIDGFNASPPHRYKWPHREGALSYEELQQLHWTVKLPNTFSLALIPVGQSIAATAVLARSWGWQADLAAFVPFFAVEAVRKNKANLLIAQNLPPRS